MAEKTRSTRFPRVSIDLPGAAWTAGGEVSPEIEAALKDISPAPAPKGAFCPVKRLADFLLSALGLIVLLIPMLLLGIIIWLDDPGPVLFSHLRVGREGKMFRLYKFRTMGVETPGYLPTSEITEPDQYLTRAGRILRRLSLDELPQLVNVLRGDMSLVGPRPLIGEEGDIHEMRLRLGAYAVRPGVTGLAQINGRDLVQPADKVRWDVQYVANFSLWQDLSILLSTFPKVFRSEGILEGDGSGEETQ